MFLDRPEWPPSARIAAGLVREADPRFLTLRYPFLTIRVANGHAVYRVETCEHDIWTGILVEGQVGQ
jgi:hypothetical protein